MIMSQSEPSFPFPAGTRVRVAQQVRVADRKWVTYVTGTVESGAARPLGGMEMGSKAAYSYQPTLRLRLDDGEITSIAIDEQTQIETLDAASPGRSS